MINTLKYEFIASVNIAPFVRPFKALFKTNITNLFQSMSISLIKGATSSIGMDNARNRANFDNLLLHGKDANALYSPVNEIILNFLKTFLIKGFRGYC